MLKLDNVTLVSVTSVRVDRTIRALKYSTKDIEFADVVLLTDKDVSEPGIKTIKINTLDYIGYSHFIVYELHKYINTDYVLIIQDDGFVTDASKWDDEFLKYDYIGAPFRLPPSNDTISYRNPFGEVMRVGNGGFSLRSKKLLSLPSNLDLEWKEYFGYYNEDGFFAVHNRHILEENGCIFPPIEIAAKFSIEHKVPESVDGKTFGFHGKSHEYNKLI
jgi:hypothetical protein